MLNKPISYQPTDGLSYDPNDEKYWDTKALNQEIERAFEICHGCRMCFKYCDAFPQLFNFIDGQMGDVKSITPRQTHAVMNACFQCKLCEVQCPYTPRENHEFQLDFPKLVHRYQAIYFKDKMKSTPTLRDKMLAEPYATAKLARASLGLANALNRVKIHRWFMDFLVGIHPDKLLPDFASETFTAKAQKKGWCRPPEEKSEVVLFPTCYVDVNEPQIGTDAMEALEANQVSVSCIKGHNCCGMPNWEHGDLATLRVKAMQNIEILLPYVEQGAKVLVINPTCSMMLRKEYVELLPEEWRAKAQRVAEATMDVTDYLWSIRSEERFNQGKSQPEGQKISYHLPCHLRVQAKGFKGRDMVRKLSGAQVLPVMECCGHDGSYAFKTESYETAKQVGQRAFAGMQSQPSEIWVTDCPLAAIQFAEHTGVKPMHPVSFVARCYREDGFADLAQEAKDEES